MHEIVTIQLGRRANYLCTHYWNTQESYQTFTPATPSLIDHDVHFRQGIAPDGTETYLPRTLIYDLKPGFGSLARTNVLGISDTDEKSIDTLWNGSLTRLPPAPATEPSPYTKSLIEANEPVLPTVSTTAFFADFASTYYHPRSLIPITPPYPTGTQVKQAELTAFAASGSPGSSNFEAGVDLFAARDAEVDILDADTRLWLEECDSLQAVQVFTSSDDAWAGFATKYVERLRDELGKGCIWVWGIDQSAVAHEPGRERRNHLQQREEITNTAITIHNLAEQASMYVPLTIPDRLPQDISLDRRSLWHTSALLESAVESATLPTRLQETDGARYTLRDWQDMLSEGGRRTIAQLKFDPDFEIQPSIQDSRMRQEDATGNEGIPSNSKSRITLAPRLSSGKLSSSTSKIHREKMFTGIQCFRGSQETLDEVLTNLKAPATGSRMETYCVPLSFSMLPTYPQIFSSGGIANPQSIRISTTLETSSELARWVRSLQSSLRYGKGSSVGGEEREAVYNSLGDIAEKYVEDWESAGESEEDD